VFTANSCFDQGMFPSMVASSSAIRCFVSRQKGVWSGRVHSQQLLRPRHVSKHGCFVISHQVLRQQTERSLVRTCSQPTVASTKACFQAWLLRHQPSGASSADRKEFGQDVFTANRCFDQGMFPSMAASSSAIRCFVSRQKGVWSGRVHSHVSKHGCFIINHPVLRQQTERSLVRTCSQACFQAWLLHHQPSGASSADRKEFGQDVFTAMFPSMAASSSTIRRFVSRQKGVRSGRVHSHVSKHGCLIINHPVLRQQTERSLVRTCSQPCFQTWLLLPPSLCNSTFRNWQNLFFLIQGRTAIFRRSPPRGGVSL